MSRPTVTRHAGYSIVAGLPGGRSVLIAPPVLESRLGIVRSDAELIEAARQHLADDAKAVPSC